MEERETSQVLAFSDPKKNLSRMCVQRGERGLRVAEPPSFPERGARSAVSSSPGRSGLRLGWSPRLGRQLRSMELRASSPDSPCGAAARRRALRGTVG